MGELTFYLALAAYPVIVTLVFDWKTASWASKNHSVVLPPELKSKMEEEGRFLFLVKFALLLVALWGLGGSALWRTVPIVTRTRSPLFLIVWGAVGGALMLGFRRLLSEASPSAALAEKHEDFLRGPTALWLMVFVIGGFVEEFWRAFCIIASHRNGFSMASGNLMASLAFSIAHQGGIPARIAGGLASIAVEILIGLMLGGLFIWSGSILPPYFASIVYYASDLLLVRRRA